ncbi:ABC transporter ATP-binding protein [Microvirga puerhi]|uniref:ABC transporter ATP-binding protein n=1 Tax=Microvirga puerhi TaxID=2876078 RepID=A0ABS7VT03_9HYPH|nr:ABC transporter ATP-binding protein [Microvirga puerhi]MBZ6078681.1 ABC transporter ATP-binding protein [Microvirga puerhi]
MAVNREPLLQVSNLKRYYGGSSSWLRAGRTIKAVEDVSFFVRPGETFGVVGESGCGKTTTGRMIVGLDRPTAGSINFAGEELTTLSAEEWRIRRRKMQMIFQNPLSALDPRMTIRRQIREPLDLHDIGIPNERDAKVEELLDAVSLQPAMADRYPHQISGGQAQRAVIARALGLDPDLVVCDEPVSALDLSVQARVTALLQDLQERRGMAYVFISHDLRIVKKLSHRVAVMYLGQIVEVGDTDDVYRQPLHPYTRALIAAIPDMAPNHRSKRTTLQGDPPSPAAPPSGCHFHTRCHMARESCAREAPVLREIGGAHQVRCHFAEEFAS